MIRPRKAERIIKSAGGIRRDKNILDHSPDSTAIYFNNTHSLYMRKAMTSLGFVTEVYMGSTAGWVILANVPKSPPLKLSELRHAVALVENGGKLFSAANDCIEEVFPKTISLVARFDIGEHVVFSCLLKSESVHVVTGVRKSASKGISYVIESPEGKKFTVHDADIRKAMHQEIITKNRINSLDDALTLDEVKALQKPDAGGGKHA